MRSTDQPASMGTSTSTARPSRWSTRRKPPARSGPRPGRGRRRRRASVRGHRGEGAPAPSGTVLARLAPTTSRERCPSGRGRPRRRNPPSARPGRRRPRPPARAAPGRPTPPPTGAVFVGYVVPAGVLALQEEVAAAQCEAVPGEHGRRLLCRQALVVGVVRVAQHGTDVAVQQRTGAEASRHRFGARGRYARRPPGPRPAPGRPGRPCPTPAGSRQCCPGQRRPGRPRGPGARRGPSCGPSGLPGGATGRWGARPRSSGSRAPAGRLTAEGTPFTWLKLIWSRGRAARKKARNDS